MHTTLETIKNELEALAASLKNIMPNDDPLSIAHNNWSLPGVGRSELEQETQLVVDFLNDCQVDDIQANEKLLATYPARLQFLRTNTVPQLWGGSAGTAVNVYLTTLASLKQALQTILPNPESIAIESAKLARKLASQLRALEARLSILEPKTGKLSSMVKRIEEAHEAADMLPTDLETLKESRETIRSLMKSATLDQGEISTLLEEAKGYRAEAEKSAIDADALVARCDDAYRATTSQGLASAFAERSINLSRSMWIWVVGLIIALGFGAYFGSVQLKNLSEVIKTSSAQHNGTIWINLILSLLSIGAPVWFAWISTKQIGQRFRLAEDYGYKASISKAYEGYRREAALLDSDFQSRLFSSALSRLDEQPLRLVEAEAHGSPWHELASSELVRNAMDAIPGFASQVSDLAKVVLSSVPSARKPTSPVQSVAVTEKPENG